MERFPSVLWVGEPDQTLQYSGMLNHHVKTQGSKTIMSKGSFASISISPLQEAFHYTRNSRENFWVEDGILNIKYLKQIQTGSSVLSLSHAQFIMHLLYQKDDVHSRHLRRGIP